MEGENGSVKEDEAIGRVFRWFDLLPGGFDDSNYGIQFAGRLIL